MLNVLLVDDDPCEHKLVDYYLSVRLGDRFRMIATGDLIHAETALESQRFDLILLDDQLRPHGNACLTAPRLRRLASDTPIYLISVSMPDYAIRGLTDHALDGFIDKFDLKEQLQGPFLDGFLTQEERAEAA